MESQAIFQAKPRAKKMLLNCHPVSGVLPPQLGLEAVLGVQQGRLVVAAIDEDL